MTEKSVNDSLQRNLVHLMNERSTSMRELSSSIDCSPSYIQKILNGKFFPSMQKLQSIAEYFEVPVSTLLSDTYENPTIDLIDSLLVELDEGSLQLTLNLVKQLSRNQK